MSLVRLRLPVLLVVLALMAGSSPFLWRKAKTFRARGLAGEAETAMGAGDPRAAGERLAAALRLAPGDSAVLRAMARYDFLQNDPRAISLWIQLIERDRGSAGDWEGLLQSALQKKDRVLSVRALEGFRKAAPEERRKARRYECRVLLLWDKTRAAADVAEGLVRVDDTDPDFALFARDLMLRGDERQSGEARRWLWGRTEDPGQGGLAAAILLARARDLTAGDQEQLAHRLRTHPLAGWESRVLAESMDIARGARGPEAAAWKKFGLALGGDDRIRTARWLASMGKARLASGLVGPDEARTRQDAVFTYLDILGAEEKWGELLAFLEDPPPSLPATLRRAYQSRGADKKGDRALSDRYWKMAVASARNDPRATAHLANYAAVLGWNDRAGDLCREMAATPGSEVPGLLGLLGLARRQKDAAAEKEILATLRTKAPRLFPANAGAPAAGEGAAPGP